MTKIQEVALALQCCGYSREQSREIASQDVNYQIGEEEVEYGRDVESIVDYEVAFQNTVVSK